MEVYAAMIECMDQGIGRIVAELQGRRILDNTLIFFLQDNGACAETTGRMGNTGRLDKPTLPPWKPDHLSLAVIPKQTRSGYPVLMGKGVMPGPEDTYIAYGRNWANVSNTPFREYKHWVHEGGVSTPLIAHWPARIKAKGELHHQAGHLIDIHATCLDVAGAKYPTHVKDQKITPAEGKSLVGAFAGRPIERPLLAWEHERNRAIRAGKWKLVSVHGKPWELYDLEADRTELNDLAARMPSRVKELAAKWEEWAKRTNVLPYP